MIDMVPAIGKYWTPGSASAAMIRAIQCHRDIQDSERQMAVRNVSATLSIVDPYSERLTPITSTSPSSCPIH